MCSCAAILARNPEQQQLPQGCLFFHIDHFVNTEDQRSCTTHSSGAEAARLTPRLSWKSGVSLQVSLDERIQNPSGRQGA